MTKKQILVTVEEWHRIWPTFVAAWSWHCQLYVIFACHGRGLFKLANFVKRDVSDQTFQPASVSSSFCMPGKTCLWFCWCSLPCRPSGEHKSKMGHKAVKEDFHFKLWNPGWKTSFTTDLIGGWVKAKQTGLMRNAQETLLFTGNKTKKGKWIKKVSLPGFPRPSRLSQSFSCHLPLGWTFLYLRSRPSRSGPTC